MSATPQDHPPSERRRVNGRDESVESVPHSVEAEQATLGCLLQDPSCWEAKGSLCAADFFRPDHRTIFGAIAALIAAGSAPDVITVPQFLQDAGRLDAAGGFPYIVKLARETATTANFAAYAKTVRDKSALRRYLSLGSRVAEAIANGATPAQLTSALRATVDEVAHTEASERSFPSIAFADLRPHVADGYVVKGLIPKNSMVGIIGPPGCGKTFLATDLAVHLASGTHWRGRPVAEGLVIYAALEGMVSAENRLCAARDHLNFRGDIPLILTAGPVNLLDREDVARFIVFAQQCESERGAKITAVIWDTLSRALQGADENSSEGMGGGIAGADAIRLATGAAVILVHHTGKDESKGARGHSSLRAALDTEIEVSKTGNVSVATVTKQRDLPTGDRFAFTLDVVELGRDSDGDPVTTCVVRAADEPAPERKAPTGKNQTLLFAALQEWQRQHPGTTHISSIDMRALVKAQGIDPRRAPEALNALSSLGWLTPAVGGYTILQEVES